VPMRNWTGLITTASCAGIAHMPPMTHPDASVAGMSVIGWADGTIILHAAAPPTPEVESSHAHSTIGLDELSTIGLRMAHTGPVLVAATSLLVASASTSTQEATRIGWGCCARTCEEAPSLHF
jgi:hypothetical protein